MTDTKICAECGNEYTGRRQSLYCSKLCYFHGHIDQTPGHGPDGDCWVWTGSIKVPSGYGQTSVDTCGVRGTAHRHAYRLACGDPGELSVLHRCDNRLCCRPDHLFLGDHHANWADAIAKGRPMTVVPKLTTQEVQAIRRSSATARELAAQHRVTAATIHAILAGRTWRHLDAA